MGDARVPNVNSGSTSANVSAAFNGAVNVNAYEIDDSVKVAGFWIVRRLYVNDARLTAVDDEIAVAVMLLKGDVSVTATVRVLDESAACATELVVTPVANNTVHCT